MHLCSSRFGAFCESLSRPSAAGVDDHHLPGLGVFQRHQTKVGQRPLMRDPVTSTATTSCRPATGRSARSNAPVDVPPSSGSSKSDTRNMTARRRASRPASSTAAARSVPRPDGRQVRISRTTRIAWVRPRAGGTRTSTRSLNMMRPTLSSLRTAASASTQASSAASSRLLTVAGSELPRSRDVHQKPNGQLALLVELFHERAPWNACRHVPVDGADVVARDVLADAVEIQPSAAEHRPVMAGQRVVDQAPAPDLDPANLLHDAGQTFAIAGRRALRSLMTCSFGPPSGNRDLVQDSPDHSVGTGLLRLGFVRHSDAVAQDVWRDSLHVLRGHVAAALQEGAGLRRQRDSDGGARGGAEPDQPTEVQPRGCRIRASPPPARRCNA